MKEALNISKAVGKERLATSANGRSLFILEYSHIPAGKELN
jgi:hypothetical protein